MERASMEALLEGLTHMWGHPVITQALENENANMRIAAISALEQLGANKEVVSALIQALGDESTDVWQAAYWALKRILPHEELVPTFIQGLQQEDWRVRLGATKALERLGAEETAKAVPSLTQILLQDDNANVRLAAASAMKITQLAQTVPAFVQALEDEDVRVRRACAEALGDIGTGASEAVLALVQALEDEDGSVRATAATSLRRIGPGAKEAVSNLAQALEDEDRTVRRTAAEALKTLGPSAKDEVPALARALDDEYWRVCLAAAETLKKIGPEAAEAVPSLIQAAERSIVEYHYGLYKTASEALTAIGPQAIPTLAQGLEDESARRREAAAGVLGDIGAETPEVVPALIHNLEDENGWVRLAATYALERPSSGERVVVVLPLDLGSGDIESEVMDTILVLLQDPEGGNWMARRAEVEALARVGPGRGKGAAFIQTLEDGRESDRQSAVKALGSFGSDAVDAVPALIRALDDEWRGVRVSAVAALGEIGPEAREAIPVLVTLLWDKDSQTSWHAGQALGKIGPQEGVVPGLIRALQDERFQVRSAAVDGLAHIGPGATEAVPALIHALQDDESWIRRRASLALKAITGQDLGGNAAAWQAWWEEHR
jgi:HEAT repeat protein